MQVINRQPIASQTSWSPTIFQPIQNLWERYIYTQLNRAHATARTIPFNNQDRIIFFSDAHRGDGGREDSFVPNKRLFLHALNHYFHKGYTYVEVGDGDELWKYPDFSRIRRAHHEVFDLLHRFKRENRLHIVTGNHDVRRPEEMETERDGLVSHEAFFLKHQESEQDLFVIHGHQVDISSSRMHHFSQWFVERFLPLLQRTGMITTIARERQQISMPDSFWSWLKSLKPSTCQVEQRLMQWASERRQMIICGHTHVHQFPRNVNVPYFNTGSCLYDKSLTGLELVNGRLQMIRWCAFEEDRLGQTVYFSKEPISPIWDLNLRL